MGALLLGRCRGHRRRVAGAPGLPHGRRIPPRCSQVPAPAAIVPLHWLTFAYMSWQAAVPTVTIVHNLQYHALVWFHNRNRYAGKTVLSRSLGAYIAAALLFSACYRIPGFQLGQVSHLAFGFFCGFGLPHYYPDSRIWRVRHDPGLREALRLVA